MPCSRGSPGCVSPWSCRWLIKKGGRRGEGGEAPEAERLSLPRQQGENRLKGASGTSPQTFDVADEDKPLLCREAKQCLNLICILPGKWYIDTTKCSDLLFVQILKAEQEKTAAYLVWPLTYAERKRYRTVHKSMEILLALSQKRMW